jgi:hypothetical protein
MKRLVSIPVLILAAVSAWPAVAAPRGDAITAEQIAAAMTGSGFHTSADQVTLLSDVVATVSNPALKIESMERWNGHQMKVRLACANHQECLPFFVAVNQDAAAQGPSANAAGARAAAFPAANGPRVLAVHAGSPAILQLDGDHIHIQLSVICLEDGQIGQTVRLSSKDRRQNYAAQVVDTARVKGRL